MDPLAQSLLITFGIVADVCYVDRNVLDFLYLVLIMVPLVALGKAFWWIRLYPRLQLDRFQLSLRLKRNGSVTRSPQISDLHLRMAKELMEQLSEDQTK